MSMTDPLQALVSLQVAIRKGIPTQATEKYRLVRVVVEKIYGRVSCAFARTDHGRVKASAMFLGVDQIDDIACFQLGYAVPEPYRGRGGATKILQQGLDELTNGLVMTQHRPSPAVKLLGRSGRRTPVFASAKTERDSTWQY